MAQNRRVRAAQSGTSKTRVGKKASKVPARRVVPSAVPWRVAVSGPRATIAHIRTENPGQVTPEERWNLIAIAAYYRAEKRGFVGGDPAQDWWEAELEIDAELARWAE